MLRLARRPAIKSHLVLPTCTKNRTLINLLGGSSAGPSNNQQYHERKILPYRQCQLYNVVADVDSYHRFVPYCTGSRVLRKTYTQDAAQDKIAKLEAELKVGFLNFEEKYISSVECRPYEMVQAVASAKIPLFKNLTTTWRFQTASSLSPHPTADLTSSLRDSAAVTDTDGPTLVTFDLEYAFANPIHAHLSAAFFGQVSKMMIRAFEERCLEVYGPGMQ